MCRAPMDIFGDHLVSRQRNGATRRHDAVREALLSVTQLAGLQARREVTGAGMDRPADILLEGWPSAVDLTCIHPLAPSGYPLSFNRVEAHPRGAEEAKTQKHTP